MSNEYGVQAMVLVAVALMWARVMPEYSLVLVPIILFAVRALVLTYLLWGKP